MAREHNLDDLNKVWEVKVLKKLPKSEEASELLSRIANQVYNFRFINGVS